MTKQEYHKKHGPGWKVVCDNFRQELKDIEKWDYELKEKYREMKYRSESSETIRQTLFKK
jgi:hypothetical protein